jgi:hypothetical protein
MIGSISRRLRSWLTGHVPAETVSVQPVVSAPPVATPLTVPAAKAVTQSRRKSSPAKRETPGRETPGRQAPERQAPERQAPEREAPAAAARKGRSTEDTLSRTVEILSSNSQVSAGEVAKSLGVSASYARSLLRRARARVAEQKPTVISTTSSVPVNKTSNEDALTGIISRLSAAETELSQLRTRPVPKDMRWDLTTRSEVLRRHSAGEAAPVIAAALAIPQGQVRFILDVNQILLAR